MSYIFSQTQIDQIRTLYLADKARIDAGNTHANYADVYAYIRDQFSGLVLEDATINNSVRWFTVATQANANTQSAFSTFIRSYTERQAELRMPEITITDALMQKASNAVAVNAIENILGTGLLPTIEEIAREDAKGVGDTIFKPYILTDTAGTILNSGWSGAVGFSGLGTDQSWRLLGGDGVLNTVGDLKDILFAYDSTFKAIEEVSIRFGSTGLALLEAGLTLGINAGALVYDIVKTIFSNTPILPYTTMVFNLTPENYLDALRKIVDPNAAQDTNASNFVDRANELFYGQNRLGGSLSIQLLSEVAPNGLAEYAKTDLAYRYALKELNPFAVFGVDYTAHNTNGELDLYNQETGQGELTEQWLIDRARFAERNAHALQTLTPNLFQSFDYFEDINTQTTIGIPVLTDKFIFGGDGNDPIEGGMGDDHLYGGAGYDVITGNDGNDYLEGNGQNDILSGGSGNDKLLGGKGDDTLGGGIGNDNLDGGLGNDTYIYNTGDGFDAIVDLKAA